MFSLILALAATAFALNGIVAPDSVQAASSFNITFQNAEADHQYRVYLAASVVGSNGPTCYLVNSTTINSPLVLTIPPSVGPSASYYSIAISDVTTSQGSTFSNKFNLTGTTGAYSEYEDHLQGAPFWSPDALPCEAYACARECAQASYPDDLYNNNAYATMRECILKCDGVSAPASTTSNAPLNTQTPTITGEVAVLTLAPGKVVTAIESGNEAMIGNLRLTINGAARTLESAGLSLVSNGIVQGESTTIVFSSVKATATPTDDAHLQTATQTDAAAPGQTLAAVAAVGLAGLAFVL